MGTNQDTESAGAGHGQRDRGRLRRALLIAIPAVLLIDFFAIPHTAWDRSDVKCAVLGMPAHRDDVYGRPLDGRLSVDGSGATWVWDWEDRRRGRRGPSRSIGTLDAVYVPPPVRYGLYHPTFERLDLYPYSKSGGPLGPVEQERLRLAILRSVGEKPEYEPWLVEPLAGSALASGRWHASRVLLGGVVLDALAVGLLVAWLILLMRAVIDRASPSV